MAICNDVKISASSPVYSVLTQKTTIVIINYDDCYNPSKMDLYYQPTNKPIRVGQLLVKLNLNFMFFLYMFSSAFSNKGVKKKTKNINSLNSLELYLWCKAYASVETLFMRL